MAEATASSLPEAYQKYYNDLTTQLLSTLGTGGADALQGYVNQFTSSAKKDYGVNGEVNQATYDKYYNQYLADQQKQLGLSGPVTADTYNKYYDELSARLLKDVGQVEYNPLSTGTIKSALQRVIRPSYDRSVQNRREATKANRAAIDADAASRGIGASTWVTDAKQRQNSAEARDIANLNADYNSALYNALMNRLAQQDQLSQNAQMANLSARQNVAGQAMSGAGNLYNADLSKYNTALSNALNIASGLYNADLTKQNNALNAAYNMAQGLYSSDANQRSQAASNALQAAWNLYQQDQASSGGGGGGGGGGSTSGNNTKGSGQVPDQYTVNSKENKERQNNRGVSTSADAAKTNQISWNASDTKNALANSTNAINQYNQQQQAKAAALGTTYTNVGTSVKDTKKTNTKLAK